MPNVTIATNITATGSRMPIAPAICPDMLSMPLHSPINAFITLLAALMQSLLTRSENIPVRMVVITAYTIIETNQN